MYILLDLDWDIIVLYMLWYVNMEHILQCILYNNIYKSLISLSQYNYVYFSCGQPDDYHIRSKHVGDFYNK
jgi:hypothetical protein